MLAACVTLCHVSSMTDHLLRMVRGLLAAISAVAGILLVLSVALNFANVVGRYFFNTSIPWAEEAMLFLMVGCVFIGNGMVAWSGRWLRMDVVLRLMPAKVREALDLLAELVFMATAVTIVVLAWPVIRDLAEFDQRSQSADFPLVIPQAMIPLGLSIMALLVAARLFIVGRPRDLGSGH
jgi:C4-dicarboxylate transporter, DctQ subunit